MDSICLIHYCYTDRNCLSVDLCEDLVRIDCFVMVNVIGFNSYGCFFRLLLHCLCCSCFLYLMCYCYCLVQYYTSLCSYYLHYSHFISFYHHIDCFLYVSHHIFLFFIIINKIHDILLIDYIDDFYILT